MKENSNPTIYAIAKKDETAENLAGTAYLKRLDCQEANKYNSLCHLEPHKVLTPVERAIQSALSSIDSSTGNSKDQDPLNILHQAGIKTRSDPDPNCNNNAFTQIFNISSTQKINKAKAEKVDEITQREVFDIIRNIQDPEHPLTLEQLNVVNLDHVEVHDCSCYSESKEYSTIDIKFTPTIPHCSMATLIGLCIRVKLLRSVPSRFKVTVRINPGTHASEHAVNRQLNDKERVIAALENRHLLSVVNKCIANGMKGSE